MNKSYAKLINGHLQYAPSVLDTPGGIIMNPKRLSYLQAGWKFLDLQPPADPAPEGKEYAISGYTETATDIRPVFKLIALNLPLGTFRSPLRSQGAVATLLVATPDRRWVCPNALPPHPIRNRRDPRRIYRAVKPRGKKRFLFSLY